MSHGLNAGAAPRANSGANGSAFASAGEPADQCTESCASTDDSGGPLAARSAFLLNVARGKYVGFALIGNAVERNGKFALAGEFSGGAGLHELQFGVETFG